MREFSLRKKPQTSNKLLMGGSWETSCEVIFISTYITTVFSLLTSFKSLQYILISMGQMLDDKGNLEKREERLAKIEGC